MRKLYLLMLLLVVFTTLATAQNSTLQGKVTTADGRPAAYVNVQVKGLPKIVATTDDGSFEIRNLQPGTYTIVVSHTGLQTQEKEVVVPTDKNFAPERDIGRKCC